LPSEISKNALNISPCLGNSKALSLQDFHFHFNPLEFLL